MGDSDACGPVCCGGSPSVGTRDYGPQSFVDGTVNTLVGPVRRVAGGLTRRDRAGAVRVRLNVRRADYRVEPGIYALGAPDDASPVLATANYKLTFDALRAALAGRDAWLLVLDTRGVNVWCAAGKKTFGTEELVRRVRAARLEQIVSHQTLVVPQLGATGVAGREVRKATGFRVVWGPVRAADLPAFLDAGMEATAEMRRVRFGLRDRAVLVPVELSFVWRFKVLAAIAVAGLASGLWRAFTPEGFSSAPGGIVVALAAAFLGGTVIVPLVLPWIPGRAFSLKGALVGAVTGGVVAVAWLGSLGPTRALLLVSLSAATASFAAMNFTGSTTFTSPSGVEHEMRRALPFQAAAALLGVVGLALAAVIAA